MQSRKETGDFLAVKHASLAHLPAAKPRDFSNGLAYQSLVKHCGAVSPPSILAFQPSTHRQAPPETPHSN